MMVSDQMQSFDERVVMPKAAIFAGGLTRYLSYVLRRTDFIGLRQRCLEWGTMIFVQTIGGQLAAEKRGWRSLYWPATCCFA